MIRFPVTYITVERLLLLNFSKTCGSSSVVEHHLAMVGVAGSNPVFRLYAPIAQLDRVSDYESEG